MKKKLREQFLKTFPVLVLRRDVEDLTGGLISSRTLANKDSRGLGPRKRVRIAGKVAYPREVLIDWILEQIEEEKGETSQAGN